MYIDWSYIILVLPAVIFSLWASANVKSSYAKYSKQYNNRGLTAADAARRVLNANGLSNVAIAYIDGELTDHYDPETNVISLSSSVHDSCSTAAVGVACHEVGHAIQFAEGYGPAKFRTAIVPITNIGAKLSVPLLFVGLLLASLSELFVYLAYAGVACYALCALFQLVTLPTEFDASRRALATIDELQLLTGDEREGARRVLRAAALTYVAALSVTLMQLLRFLIILSGRRD